MRSLTSNAAIDQLQHAKSPGLLKIAEERFRQIEDLGHTPENDYKHNVNDELIDLVGVFIDKAQRYNDEKTWIQDSIMDLVKAGALIAAEIDRLLLVEKENKRQTT